MADLPGVPLPSGFDNYMPWDESPFALTRAEQAEWQAYLDDVKRAHLRAMETADRYVLGASDIGGSGADQ